MLSSCCCFSLRTGGFLIGCLGIIINIFRLVQGSVTFFNNLHKNDVESELSFTITIVFLAIGLIVNGFLVVGVIQVSFILNNRFRFLFYKNFIIFRIIPDFLCHG